MKNIKNYLPPELKRIINIKYHYVNLQHIKNKKNQIKKLKDYLESIKNSKKIYILDACDHRNLGDQAILLAEYTFLKNNFYDYEIVIVGLSDFEIHSPIVFKYINPNDLIFLHGGGNLGNEYKRAEYIRRTIISNFPNNKIILFPQTIFFSENDEGRNELSKSIQIYSQHRNLTLIARERTSYELMKKYFNCNNVILTPDIVFYLNKTEPTNNRNGALLCLREDLEGILKDNDKKLVIEYLHSKFLNVKITDTIGENSFTGVEKKLNEFRNAEVVITDRLHGMVFAAITGTPCIALSNYNYKVQGTYEWIKDLGYIKFASGIDQIPSLLESLLSVKENKYDNSFSFPYYNLIVEAIRN